MFRADISRRSKCGAARGRDSYAQKTISRNPPSLPAGEAKY